MSDPGPSWPSCLLQLFHAKPSIYQKTTDHCDYVSVLACDDGWYGVECISQCGKCRTNTTLPGPCIKEDGSCPLGCAPGYYNDAFCKSGNMFCYPSHMQNIFEKLIDSMVSSVETDQT